MLSAALTRFSFSYSARSCEAHSCRQGRVLSIINISSSAWKPPAFLIIPRSMSSSLRWMPDQNMTLSSDSDNAYLSFTDIVSVTVEPEAPDTLAFLGGLCQDITQHLNRAIPTSPLWSNLFKASIHCACALGNLQGKVDLGSAEEQPNLASSASAATRKSQPRLSRRLGFCPSPFPWLDTRDSSGSPSSLSPSSPSECSDLGVSDDDSKASSQWEYVPQKPWIYPARQAACDTAKNDKKE